MKRLVKGIFRQVFNVIALFSTVSKSMVFESRSDYCDNSKALFLEALKYKVNEEYRIYWLVSKKEKFDHISIKNVKFVSLEYESSFLSFLAKLNAYRLTALSNYFFYTHQNLSKHRPRKNQVVFNLTHGTSLKNTKGKHDPVKNNSYILSTSDFMGSIRLKSYDSGQDKLVVLGYPRNDLLFEDTKALMDLSIDKPEDFSLVLWMPTYRRHINKLVNDTDAKEDDIDLPLLKKKAEWDLLNQKLKKEKLILLIKPHPAQDLSFMALEEKENIKIVKNEDLEKAQIELYHLIGKSDLLITDYSSTYIDYLLLDRPIAFTVDDMKEYKDNTGFLVEDPLSYMPGAKLESFSDLIELLEDFKNKEDPYIDERKRILDLFHQYKDENSSKRILEFLGF